MGCHEYRRARFAVERLLPVVVDGADGNGVAGIGVAVVVNVIVILQAVPRRPDVNTPQFAATVSHAIFESCQSQGTWTFQSLTVVRGTPTIVVDIDFLVLIAQGVGFVEIARGFGHQAQAC